MNFITEQGQWYKNMAEQINDKAEKVILFHHQQTPYCNFFKTPSGFRWALLANYRKIKAPQPKRIGFLSEFLNTTEQLYKDGKIKFIKRGD